MQPSVKTYKRNGRWQPVAYIEAEVRRRRDTEPIKVTAAALGIPISAVSDARGRLGLTNRGGKLAGLDRATYDQHRAHGMSHKAIARRYGLTGHAVAHKVKREGWRSE